MGKLAESTKKKVVLKKKASPKVESLKVSEKPIIKITTKKSIFPELKPEEIYTTSGMLTKRGIVYLFYRCNREKVCKPIKASLKTVINDKSLFGVMQENFIDSEFDRACLSAFEKASEKSDKTNKQQLIEYIQNRMKDLQTTMLNDFAILDI